MPTLLLTRHFKKQYQKLPSRVQHKVDTQIKRLVDNPDHPALRVKKMVNTSAIWEARIDIHHRMTFQMDKNTIIFRRVGAHDVLKHP
jgi:mRNA-degrading endonuclease RelE of RelBE toxin-antitoxin system